MEVYLDNSATTKCSESVCAAVTQAMTETYGNPSSLHQKGLDAENIIKHSIQQIGRILKASEKEILFTSGGTESNNLAVIGAAMANRRKGMHLITTQIEHPSVKNPMKFLQEQGFEVTCLPVDAYGTVSLQALEEAVRDDTILVSVMHVNNEIGTIQPIEQVSKLVKGKNPNVCIHVDAVQGFGREVLVPKKMGIDLLSASGHKIHGPKGVGFLYVGETVRIAPILYGGGQQQDLRSGTENVPGIAGMGQAAEEIYQNLEQKTDAMYQLRDFFIEQVIQLPDVSINGYSDRRSAPHIISVNFQGLRSEVLLHALEEKGVYVSSGSACASNKRSVSEVLTAIGRSKEQAEGTIRFSMSGDTTREQLEYCLEQLRALLPVLRRYTRH